MKSYNYHNNRSKRRAVILVLLAFLMSIQVYSQSYSLHVGEPIFIPTPDPMYNGYVNNANWTTSGFNLTISEQSAAGAIVEPNTYFEGHEYVTCVYTFTYYSGGRQQVGQTQKTFPISCIAINAKLSQNVLEMNVGQKTRLTYTLSESGYNKTPKWSSSNEDVVTVDKNGNVKAIRGGSATIYLDPVVGPVVTCKVTVNSIQPTKFAIESPVYITVGKKKTLSYSFAPEGASAEISWMSENTEIAKVSTSGIVTGVQKGTTRIVGKTSNGLSSSCDVIIMEPPTSVSLPSEMTVYSGYTQQLIPTLQPENTETTYTWASNDTSIAKVDVNGNVKGYNVGTTEITVTTENKLKAKCTIVVKETPDGVDYRNVTVRLKAIHDLVKKTLNK